MSEAGSISALTARLRAAGATPEMIADVLETFAATLDGVRNSTGIPVDRAAAKRRAYDRERKAAAKARSTGNSTGIPPENAECTPSPPDGPLSPPAPPLSPLNPPTPSAPRRERGCALPADWRPIAKHFAMAADLGRDRLFVEQQAEAMREWAGANRNRAVARKADWDLTFTGWLRREATRGQPGRGPPRNGKPTNADLMQHFADELRAKHEPSSDRTEESGAGHGFGRGPGAGAPLFERPRLEREFSGPTLDLVAGSAVDR